MIENLLWLFPAYRALQAENAALRTLAESLERQLREGTSSGFSNMIKDFQDQVLTDQPYAGRIPDEVWLTPGENDRGQRGA